MVAFCIACTILLLHAHVNNSSWECVTDDSDAELCQHKRISLDELTRNANYQV